MISVSDAAAERYLSDVAVATDRPAGRRVQPVRPSHPASGETAALEPVTIPATDSIEVREGYIEIQRLPDYDLVTSIEVLSPWNKHGEGIGEYRHWRRALVGQGVHVVEVDLLRRGTRTELAQPLPPGDYYAFVFRADRRPNVDVYAWGLRDALPPVPVPLRPPDADVPLDLPALVATVYDRGGYARKLRYDRPPTPALTAVQSAWAAERLRVARK